MTTPVKDDPDTEIDETMLSTEGIRTTMDNARLNQAVIDILTRSDKSIPIERLDELWFDGILSEQRQQDYNELLEK